MQNIVPYKYTVQETESEANMENAFRKTKKQVQIHPIVVISTASNPIRYRWIKNSS